MKKEIPLTDHEKFAQAKDEFIKAVMESGFGKFLLWMVDRISRMISKEKKNETTKKEPTLQR